ncbi:hypothetical protein [Streptomyces sp. NPDC007369]|uniref:hypothetical protein n=1 Tax=Streptomyces sp. NPDC007369 TaxID=3154589 RepID=UPI0033EB6086
MNKAVRTRAGVALAGAALLLGGLTACGSEGGKGAADAAEGGKPAAAAGKSPQEAVKAAYAKTLQAKTAAFQTTSVQADGKTTEISGTVGWYPTVRELKQPSGKRQVMLPGLIYTEMDKPLDGKTWMKMNLAKDGKPTARFEDTPVEYLALMIDQPGVQHAGTEQAGGLQAEHYRGTFTLDQLLASDEKSRLVPDAERAGLREALQRAGITSYGLDVWIDKDGRPVKVEAQRTDDKGVDRVTSEFSQYGAAPAVQVPPEGDTADFDAVMKGVGESLADTEASLKGTRKSLKETEKSLAETDEILRGLGR